MTIKLRLIHLKRAASLALVGGLALALAIFLLVAISLEVAAQLCGGLALVYAVREAVVVLVEWHFEYQARRKDAR